MAISKVIFNGVTQMDVTQNTVTSDTLVSPATATKNDGTPVIGGVSFSTIYSGSSAPASSLGVNGDIYLQTGS